MKDIRFWTRCADEAQQSLWMNFWNSERKIMNAEAPYIKDINDRFHYWWQAHVVDAFLDGYERTYVQEDVFKQLRSSKFSVSTNKGIDLLYRNRRPHLLLYTYLFI